MNEDVAQGGDFFHPGALRQVSQGLLPFGAGVDLQVDLDDFGGQVGIAALHLLGHPLHGGVEPLAGFHADHHQVQGVGQAFPDLFLASGDEAPQDQGRQEVTGRQQQIEDRHHEAFVPGLLQHPGQGQNGQGQGQSQPQPQVDRQGPVAAVAGLGQASLGFLKLGTVFLES